MDFEYELLHGPTSLRLLKVSREKRAGQIQIELWEQVNPVAYRCLSYMWGDSSLSFTIQVNGRSMQVGENLHDFLVVAAERFAEEPLWIDAICINQGDMEEKRVQVQKMGKTFREAIEVLVWLGNSSHIADLFASTRTTLSELKKDLSYTAFDQILEEFRSGAYELRFHPYWERAWIKQELALAQHLRFLSKMSDTTVAALRQYADVGSLDLSDYICISQIRSSSSAICRLETLNESTLADHVLDALFRFLDSLGVGDPMVFQWKEQRRNDQRDGGLGGTETQVDCNPHQRLDIWQLDIEKACCRELRDRIYSVLEIVRATDFRVDYNESDASTFWRAATRFAAWQNPGRLSDLWKVFEFDQNMFQRAVDDESSQTMRCSIPVRRAGLRNYTDKSTFFFHEHRFCEYSESDERKFTYVDKREILLCSYDSRMNRSFHSRCVHFILQPLDAGNGGPFRILVDHMLVRSSCLQMFADTEIGFAADDSERIIVDMEDVRSTSLKITSSDDWEAGPHFVLKLPARYVVDTVKEYKEDLRKLMKKYGSDQKH
jgi:hypothetical protein